MNLYLEQAMVQRHLESDRIFKDDIKGHFLTECISQLIAKVSHNMSSHHTCSRFMNDVGQNFFIGGMYVKGREHQGEF
jgi:hypothetical protein